MIELGREMARAVRVDWNAARVQAAEVGLRKRRQRRTVARASLAAAVAVAIAVWAMWPRSEPARLVAWQPPSLPAIEQAESRHVVAVPSRDAATILPSPTDQHASRTRARGARLAEIAAIFASADYARRIDAVFADLFVAHESDDRHADGARDARDARRSDRGASRQPEPATASVASETWRELAQNGEFDKAYVALAAPDAPPVRDVPDELLLVADIKRLSHHAAEAVAPLRQILRDHAADQRAPLAAFTLGRVLLELGRPAEAAAAFAQTDSLAPRGPLAEDALARQVEALAKSGDAKGAQLIAEQYIARFPHGRKLRSVRRFGGLP